MLAAGHFVCGYSLFIAVRMPSCPRDHGLSCQVASESLVLIGLFNMLGTTLPVRWAGVLASTAS